MTILTHIPMTERVQQFHPGSGSVLKQIIFSVMKQNYSFPWTLIQARFWFIEVSLFDWQLKMCKFWFDYFWVGHWLWVDRKSHFLLVFRSTLTNFPLEFLSRSNASVRTERVDFSKLAPLERFLKKVEFWPVSWGLKCTFLMGLLIEANTIKKL